MAQCTAKSKQSGEQCKRNATPGRDKCAMHGGKSTGAPFRAGGRYSGKLPQRLEQMYQELRANPELIHLNDDVALLEVRIAEVLQNIEEHFNAKYLEDLMTAYNQCLKGGDEGAAAFIRLGDLIKQGRAYAASWNEIVGLIDAKRKVARVQMQHVEKMQQVVPAMELFRLVTELLRIVLHYVPDATEQAKIGRDFDLVMRGHTQIGTVIGKAGQPALPPGKTN